MAHRIIHGGTLMRKATERIAAQDQAADSTGSDLCIQHRGGFSSRTNDFLRAGGTAIDPAALDGFPMDPAAIRIVRSCLEGSSGRGRIGCADEQVTIHPYALQRNPFFRPDCKLAVAGFFSARPLA
jgi:hypothetical protein